MVRSWRSANRRASARLCCQTPAQGIRLPTSYPTQGGGASGDPLAREIHPRSSGGREVATGMATERHGAKAEMKSREPSLATRRAGSLPRSRFLRRHIPSLGEGPGP